MKLMILLKAIFINSFFVFLLRLSLQTFYKYRINLVFTATIIAQGIALPYGVNVVHFQKVHGMSSVLHF